MPSVPTRIRAWLAAIPLEYRLLLLMFVGSRIALRALGFPYSIELTWMFLDDPHKLESNLLGSLLDFHAYPPGMNLFTGILLKLAPGAAGPESIAALAQTAFAISGLILAGSLLYLLRAIGLSRFWALGIAAAFTLSPPILYLENLYIYTYPVATLVCFGGACLHRALMTGSRAAFTLLFVCAAWLGIIRSTFHVSWFFALFMLTVLMVPRTQRVRVLACAAIPLIVLLALYSKNYLRFDSFGATSAGGGNLSLVTVRRMPKEMRENWVRTGKLSPIAKISAFAPPSAYQPHFGSPNSERWPELSALTYKNGTPNYNHWFFMEANRLRTADAFVVLDEAPGIYIDTVVKSLKNMFTLTTRWHPAAGKEPDPHFGHNQLLGGYAEIYRQLVHRFPLAPVGLYWFLALAYGFGLYRTWKLRTAPWEDNSRRRAELGLLLYTGFQITFVVVISSLFTYGESSRYRIQVEAMIWLLLAYAGLALVSQVRAAIQQRSARTA